MQRALLLITVPIALAGALWLGLRPRTQPGTAASPAAQRSAQRDTAAPTSAAGVPADSRLPVAEGSVAGEEAQTAANEPLPQAHLSALELLVQERHSRKPLAGLDLRLRLEGGETQLVVQTDAAGRARTPAVWSPGTVWIWHSPGARSGPYEVAWELEPWQVAIPEGVALREAVVLAERPDLVLEVEVVAGADIPVEQAEISLVHGWRDRAGRFHATWVDPVLSDAEGHARYGLSGAERDDVLLLQAEDLAGGRGSAAAFLEPPHTRGPWRLHLQPAGSVLVRAFDEQGHPLERGFAHAVSARAVEHVMSSASGRIDGGVGRLAGLGPGPWRLVVRHAGLHDVRRVEVEVRSGRESVVEVRFDDGTTALAASGQVLDEQDRPLADVTVWMDIEGRTPSMLRSGADGRFLFVAHPAAEVTVGTGNDVGSDAFEPVSLRVPFGSSGLVLRRARELQRRTVSFEVVDLQTGRPPARGGGVFVLLGPPRAMGGWAWEALVEGRAGVPLKAHDGLRWRVQCEGYRQREGEVPPLDAEPEGGVIRVALERGFERSLVVLDARTGRPLAQARVLDPDGTCSATSDQGGVARLTAPTWPARLRVEREGYCERLIDPGDLELVDDRVALEPLAGG